MKFYPVTGTVTDNAELTNEYKAARAIGVVRIGEKHLFYRGGLKVHCVPYGDIRRCYRRVLLVPARMCCGRGELQVENLVLQTDEGELPQIQLPGTKAAKELMEVLKAKMPDAQFTCPAPAKS